MTRILITGFGPFPGAPSNPTMRLVRHLVRLKRARFTGVERFGQVLATEWGALQGFRNTIRKSKPDCVLMFGLAGRRRKVTPEARAANVAGLLRVDGAGHSPASRSLLAAGPAHRRGRIDAVRMAAGLRRAGIAADVSQNAGDYLCNALFWTALESGVPAIFVHVPKPKKVGPKKSALPTDTQKPPRLTMKQLERAAEMALSFSIASVRGS